MQRKCIAVLCISAMLLTVYIFTASAKTLAQDNYNIQNSNRGPLDAQFAVSPDLAVGGVSADLGVPSLYQHKDTRMLCVHTPLTTGCSHIAKHGWDVDHISRGDVACAHCDMYCVRAAIAMINRYYGGHISQDRISYYLLGGGGPEDDLGHGRGLYPSETTNGLSWALYGASLYHSVGKPSFMTIKGWIDAGRPVLRRDTSGGWHATVIDGYDWSIEPYFQRLHVIDPWTKTESTFNYATLSIYEVWVPPAGSSGRSDESSVNADTDGDGIVNFDELYRFPTYYGYADSDMDGALDKMEIIYYHFIQAGTSTHNPSIDGDGIRMEIDPDESPPLRGTPLAVGDFNLDGYDDLAIGAPGEDIGTIVDAGAVNVLYGKAPGLQATSPNDQLWHQNTAGVKDYCERSDHFGAALAVGDFNLDGYDDLAIGVLGESFGTHIMAGAVNVLYGTSSGLHAGSPNDQFWHQDSYSIVGMCESYDMFGAALATGDFDLDGYDDLAVGAPGEGLGTNYGVGAVNVLYGSSGKLTYIGDQMWHQDVSGVLGGSEKWDHFGAALAAGDFDLDGYDDLAIGVPRENIGTTRDDGCVNVLYGSSGVGLTSAGDQIWYQANAAIIGASEADDHFGAALATGDFDHDGYDDLVIGVPGEDVGSIRNAGAVNVLYGTSTGLLATGDQMWHQSVPGMVWTSCEHQDMFGAALATGDFDLDGYDDLAVGVPGEGLGSSYGKYGAGLINVLYGSYGIGLTATGDQVWHQDSSGIAGYGERRDNFGAALTAGDFDHDGYDDVAIGVPGEDIGTIRETGCVNVLYGSFGVGLTSAGDQLWHQNSYSVAGYCEPGDRFG